MNSPRVSVCVPTYNGSAFLADTLQSISEQTFSDFEVVVVDDSSQDDTVAIAERHAAKDVRVRVLRNEQRVGSSARNANRCLTHARGEWIKFLFQDDLMKPTCLERALEAGTTGRFVICSHDYLFAPDVEPDVRRSYEELPTIRTVFGETYVPPEDFCRPVLRLWTINFLGPTSACFVHRDCFNEHGAFSAEIVTVPDLECWIRIGSHDGLAIVPEPVVTYRVHGQSISAKIRHSKALQYRARLDRLLLLLNLAKTPEYDNVRTAAWQLRPPMDPDIAIAQAAVQERRLAVEARYYERDDSMLKEWKAFCRRHPQIADVLREADARSPKIARLKLYLKEWL